MIPVCFEGTISRGRRQRSPQAHGQTGRVHLEDVIIYFEYFFVESSPLTGLTAAVFTNNIINERRLLDT